MTSDSKALRKGPLTDGLFDPAKTTRESIDAVFDLNDPDQAKALEGHKAAFGEGYAGVEPLSDGKVVLKMYPGGAKELKKKRKLKRKTGGDY